MTYLFFITELIENGSATTEINKKTLKDILSVYSYIYYNSEDYIKEIFANFYVSAFLFIERLSSKEEQKEILKNLDKKILKSTTKLQNKAFLIMYKILGFKLSMKLVRIARKIKYGNKI